MVTEDDFDIVTNDRPRARSGQALVKVHYLSLDPYMRPMMDPLRSYVPHLNPNDLMPGATVGEVIESNEPSLPVGTFVAGLLGWQTYGLVTKDTCRVIDPANGPVSAALHVLGMTGATAHYGLLELAKPQPGETVVVTAASGAVGSVVGQLAKIKGCSRRRHRRWRGEVQVRRGRARLRCVPRLQGARLRRAAHRRNAELCGRALRERRRSELRRDAQPRRGPRPDRAVRQHQPVQRGRAVRRDRATLPAGAPGHGPRAS